MHLYTSQENYTLFSLGHQQSVQAMTNSPPLQESMHLRDTWGSNKRQESKQRISRHARPRKTQSDIKHDETTKQQETRK